MRLRSPTPSRYLSELLDPVSIVLRLTHRNLMRQSFAYLIWGEGETA